MDNTSQIADAMSTTAGLVAENDGRSESPEDRFTCNFEVPTLEKLALNRVAQSIWYGHISRSEFLSKINEHTSDENPMTIKDRFNKYRSRIKTETKVLPEVLKTPRCIEDMIKKSLEDVVDESFAWTNHLRNMFRSKFIPHRINCVDPNWWVWCVSGALDFKKTDMTMLASGKLSKVQKFVVRCRHCLEDEIVAELDDLSVSGDIEMESLDEDPVMHYWIFRVKNRLCKARLPILAQLYVDMAENFCSQDSDAFEFVWRCMDETNQESILRLWISRVCDKNSWMTIERIFSSMSWIQQSRILSQIPVDIIITFVIYSPYLEFSYKVFRMLPKDTLKELILSDPALLTEYFDVEFSDKMLDLCSSSPDDRFKFKQSLSRSIGVMKMCMSKIECGNFESLRVSLDWYFSGESGGAETFRKKLLQEIRHDVITHWSIIHAYRFFVNVDEWKKFCNFIDETLLDDERRALEEKQWWISFMVENIGTVNPGNLARFLGRFQVWRAV